MYECQLECAVEFHPLLRLPIWIDLKRTSHCKMMNKNIQFTISKFDLYGNFQQGTFSLLRLLRYLQESVTIKKYPLIGSRAISNGSIKPSAIRTVLLSPSKVEISIRLDPDSTMYKWFVIQSTAKFRGKIKFFKSSFLKLNLFFALWLTNINNILNNFKR